MAITNGPLLNSVLPAAPQALATNYIDFTTFTTTEGDHNNWGQQYLPDLMEKEAEVFGPRTISGFLSKVGAEEAMQADQVVWSEQGRLHLSYKGHLNSHSGGQGSGGEIEIEVDIDGNDIGANHGVRVNDTVLIANSQGVVRCIVCATDTPSVIDVQPYDFANLSDAGLTTVAGTQDTTILVYGSEYGKGMSYRNAANDAATDTRGANEPSFQTFSNKPIILKDYYEVSGSDTARVGWVEIATEDGKSGYAWYLKAESDTRARFNDYLEMAMIEGQLNLAASTIDGADLVDGSVAGAGNVGTEGLFAAIESRGNMTGGVTGADPADDFAEFDLILAEFDRQGAIEENMMFLNRETSLAVDDMLASVNGAYSSGTSYGVFENDENMALNLGFSGFRRGSYDFYKSDFRYLNDLATRGVIIPAGTSTVYDQSLGKNLKRPFLHVRYRASKTDNRKLKSWVTGSVGAATSALDAMQIHMLSERCLVTQGANNFMLMN
jgi:hypothetical protein